MKRLSDQSGIVHIMPLLFIVAAVGVISFLLISSAAPFKGGLFGTLNPKPVSHAMSMMTLQDNCKFFTDQPGTPVAFCDTFDLAHPGGRNGDLDDSRWQYSRLQAGGDNPSQGEISGFGAVDVVRCQSIVKGVLPDNDSFICGLDQPEPESNHWMEAIADGGGIVNDAAIIKQPFDFTNRTGVITFDTDAKTAGGHSWWPTICFSDSVYFGNQVGIVNYPANGFCIDLDETTGTGGITDLTQQPIALGGMGFASLSIFNNYVHTNPWVNGDFTGGDPSYVTQPDHANHFEIRISKDSFELWASDKTDDGINFPNFRRRFFADNINLPITRGFVTFGQGHYNGAKDGFVDEVTYHWHGVGFDGPTLPTVRGYDIPDGQDATTVPAGTTGVNLGYSITSTGISKRAPSPVWWINVPNFSFQNVNVSGATGGYISANVFFPTYPQSSLWNNLMYRINGDKNPSASWINYTLPSGQLAALQATLGAGPSTLAIPINVSNLVSGTNIIEFKTSAGQIDLANISLDLTPGDILPLESNHISYTPANGTAMPSMTPMPSSTPTPGTCPKASLGDIDCDGTIGIFDFNTLVTNFGKTVTGIQGDLDGSGKVDIFDFNTLVTNFGH